MSAELGTQKKEPLLAPLPTNIKYLMENFKKPEHTFDTPFKANEKPLALKFY